MVKPAALIIGICIALTANAQNDSLATYVNMSFEELLNVKMITAGKQEQQVKDIPASVVVITRADIEEHGYRSVTEILQNIPGMYSTNDYSVGGVNFGVRGYWSVIPNDDIMILVNDVDQVELPYLDYDITKNTVPVEAIERIEVIRGPMSVLYGSGAFYGVVNIFTRNVNPAKPSASLVSGQIGTQQTGKATLKVSGNQKDYNYTLNASVFKSSGIDQPFNKMNDNASIFKTRTTKGLLEKQEIYMAYAGNFKHFYTDLSYNESNGGLMFLAPSAGNGSTFTIRATNLLIGYKNTFAQKWLFDGKFSYYSTYKKQNYDHFHQNTYEIQDVPSTGYDLDLSINGNLTRQLHLTAGARFRSILSVENNMHLPTTGFGIFYNTTQTIDDNDNINSWAAFVQFDYRPFEKLVLVAGGRIEQQLDYILKSVVGDTTLGMPANVFLDKYSQHNLQFIPRAAAIFSLANNHILKLMYGKAVNTPSWFQIQNAGIYRLSLKPEEIQSFEINSMAIPFPKLRINTSIFYNMLNHLIVRTLGINDQGIYFNYNSNTGKVETKGMELTMEIKPFEILDIEMSATYQKSIDKARKKITYNYSPNLLGNIKIICHISSHLSASIIANYVDHMETNWLENPDGTGSRIGKAVPSYYTIGANLRISDLLTHGLYCELHGSNLLNHDVIYPATTNNNNLFPKGTLDIGRQIIFTLGYKF